MPARGAAAGRAVLVVLALVGSACSPAGPPETGPPAVDWGYDACDRCGMILGEPEHSAVARGPAGEVARFDDPGCLVAWLEEHGEEGWTSWVGDAGGGGWVAAEEAWVVRAPSRLTPMGSGWLVYARRQEALAAATAHGVAAPGEAGLSRAPSSPPAPPPR